MQYNALCVQFQAPSNSNNECVVREVAVSPVAKLKLRKKSTWLLLDISFYNIQSLAWREIVAIIYISSVFAEYVVECTFCIRNDRAASAVCKSTCKAFALQPHASCCDALGGGLVHNLFLLFLSFL